MAVNIFAYSYVRERKIKKAHANKIRYNYVQFVRAVSYTRKGMCAYCRCNTDNRAVGIELLVNFALTVPLKTLLKCNRLTELGLVSGE